MPFICTICEEESTRICVACTKDTCGNHLCEKCKRCSDCCDCELHLEVQQEDAEPVDIADATADLEHALADPAPEPMPIPGFPGPEQNN